MVKKQKPYEVSHIIALSAEDYAAVLNAVGGATYNGMRSIREIIANHTRRPRLSEVMYSLMAAEVAAERGAQSTQRKKRGKA